jgi:hypothetical protein
MLRRIALGTAAGLFVAATVSAVVVVVGVIRLAIDQPGVAAGTAEVIRLRPWGWGFFGSAATGFVVLCFVRDGGPGRNG